MSALPDPRYGAIVRACIRTRYADAASSPGRPSAQVPCAAVTPLVVRAPCEQMHEGTTRSRVGRYFDAAPERTRCGRAAAGSSSNVARCGERSAADLWMLYGSRLMQMAGLERVSCSMPAVVCVYRRPPVASGTGTEAETAGARVRTVWGFFN